MSWKTSVSKTGEYVRKASSFRNFITKDGSSGFPAEPNRYHLYISHACPWAHRTMLFRALKGLDNVISYTAVDWFLGDGGWRFSSAVEGSQPDPEFNASFLRELYLRADPDYVGNVTVPVLWDKKKKAIVNNESSEIIRMFNTEFNEWAQNKTLDLYPMELREQINDLNDWIYPSINNGVYRCGFATSQAAYDEAYEGLFTALDRVEAILAKNRYLTGSIFTEADVRLFTTLVRFDPVYVLHFKTNKKRIIDYSNIWGYVREIYNMPKVKDTINMHHIKHHYFVSHTAINPKQIVPRGPELDFGASHNRSNL